MLSGDVLTESAQRRRVTATFRHLITENVLIDFGLGRNQRAASKNLIFSLSFYNTANDVCIAFESIKVRQSVEICDFAPARIAFSADPIRLICPVRSLLSSDARCCSDADAKNNWSVLVPSVDDGPEVPSRAELTTVQLPLTAPRAPGPAQNMLDDLHGGTGD
jgi:hypothetical protein